MTSRKQRNRTKKRVMSLLDDAFAALAAGEHALAAKLSHRAVAEGFVNPRVWVDHGRILWAVGERRAADEAVRRAIAIAPPYARAFAALARMQDEAGKPAAAARLYARAVELAPDDAESAARLRELGGVAADAEPPPAEAPVAAPPQLTALTGRYEWDAVGAAVRERGFAPLPALLDPRLRDRVRDLRGAAVARELAVAAEHGGAVEAELAEPLPDELAALRVELRARAAVLADGWHDLLGIETRHDPRLDGIPRATRWSLPADGFVPYTSAAGGRSAFPFVVLATLGPAAVGFALLDVRPGKGRKPRTTAVEPGDGLVFCCRERMVRVGGVWGLQAVRYGFRAEAATSALELWLQ